MIMRDGGMGTHYVVSSASITCSRCGRHEGTTWETRQELYQKIQYFTDRGWQYISGRYVCKDCAAS